MQTNEEKNSNYQTEADFVEDVSWDQRDPNDDKVTADFIQRFNLEYQTPSGARYNPKMNAHTDIGTQQRGFYVHYAFPNGTKKPVASFWATTEEKQFRMIHIDLGRAMERIIQYYENRGWGVPPMRDPATVGK